jgi:cardiolipin synthase
VDGYAARKLGISGRLGVILDPLADKVLLVVVFIAMGFLGLVPLWLFILVVVRDLVIVIGASLVRLLRNIREFRPSTLGKVSTFFQIVLALLAVVYAAFPYEWIRWLKITGVVLTAIFTTVSGLDYVRQGIEMARQPPLETN